MNDSLDLIFQQFVCNREDVFGKGSTFVSFKASQNVEDRTLGCRSTSLTGRIVYQKEGPTQEISVSQTFFVKLSLDKYYIDYLDIFPISNEIFFFTRILPFYSSFSDDFEQLFAKYNYGQVQVGSGPSKGLIIFDHLKASGYQVCTINNIFLDYDHLALMLRKLGQFHAFSYRAKNVDPTRFYNMCTSFVNAEDICRYSLTSKIGLRIVSTLQEEHSRYSSKRSKLVEAIESLSKPNKIRNIYRSFDRDPMSVLCHGDYFKVNVLFKYDCQIPNDLKMVDMADCVLAPPCMDLLHVLYIHADQQMRMEHWDDLLAEYYNALEGTFSNNPVPTKIQIVEQFRTNFALVYSMIAFLLPSVMDFRILMKSPEKEAAMKIFSDSLESGNYVNLGKGDRGTKVVMKAFKDMVDRGFF